MPDRRAPRFTAAELAALAAVTPEDRERVARNFRADAAGTGGERLLDARPATRGRLDPDGGLERSGGDAAP